MKRSGKITTSSNFHTLARQAKNWACWDRSDHFAGADCRKTESIWRTTSDTLHTEQIWKEIFQGNQINKNPICDLQRFALLATCVRPENYLIQAKGYIWIRKNCQFYRNKPERLKCCFLNLKSIQPQTAHTPRGKKFILAEHNAD